MQASKQMGASRQARLLSDLTDIVYDTENGTNQDFDHFVNSFIESVQEQGIEVNKATLLDQLRQQNKTRTLES